MPISPLVAQMVKHLPAMQETQVWALGREDLLEKGMATHCSILAWRIAWTEEPSRLQSMGWQRVGHDWATNTFTFGASLVAQMVKNLPAMQETWIWSLGWEDPLEKGMATHCSILAWRSPWTEEPGELHTVHEITKSDTTESDWHTHKTQEFHNFCFRTKCLKKFQKYLKSC